MSLSKLWNLMSKHAFMFSDESGHNDLRCVMCKNIMVNAVVSNVCGCHYCYQCISEYINGNEKYCPSGKRYCKDEILKLNENAVKNNLLNKRISILSAKCPNESCECYVELIEMEDHLRLCRKQSMGCPYVAIGCISEMSNEDEIMTHLHRDTMTHTELLIELIMNLRNEVCGLKEDIVGCKLEIDFLKKPLMMKEERNMKLENENDLNERRQNEAIQNLRNDVKDGFEKNKLEISSLKEELSKKENIIVDVKAELREMRNEVDIRVNEERYEKEKYFEEQRRLVKDEKTKNEVAIREIEAVAVVVNDLKVHFEKNVGEELMRNETRIVALEERLERVKNEVDNKMARESERINKEINEQRRHIEDARVAGVNVAKLVNNVRKDIDKIIGNFSKNREEKNLPDEGKKIRKYNTLHPNIVADFVWRIDGVSKNLNKNMWSESFYSNNYKLCLKMYINSYSNDVELWCYIMKGDNDERVEWPLKREVTLSIIDQSTLGTHKSETNQCEFNKPTNDRGGYVGNYSFIKYSSIKDQSAVVANDSIIVSCVISDL